MSKLQIDKYPIKLDDNNLPICKIKYIKDESYLVETMLDSYNNMYYYSKNIFSIIINDKLLYNHYDCDDLDSSINLAKHIIYVLLNLHDNDSISVYFYKNTPLLFKGIVSNLNNDKIKLYLIELEKFLNGKIYSLDCYKFLKIISTIVEDFDIYMSERFKKLLLDEHEHLDSTFYEITKKNNYLLNKFYFKDDKFNNVFEFCKFFVSNYSDIEISILYNNSSEFIKYTNKDKDFDKIRHKLLSNLDEYNNIQQVKLHFYNNGLICNYGHIDVKIIDYIKEKGYDYTYFVNPTCLSILPKLE